jgi:hypothetical protein
MHVRIFITLDIDRVLRFWILSIILIRWRIDFLLCFLCLVLVLAKIIVMSFLPIFILFLSIILSNHGSHRSLFILMPIIIAHTFVSVHSAVSVYLSWITKWFFIRSYLSNLDIVFKFADYFILQLYLGWIAICPFS